MAISDASSEDGSDSTMPLLEPSKSLVVCAFLNDTSSSIGWDAYFCGHFPAEIVSLCQKYLEMDHTFHLNPPRYFSPIVHSTEDHEDMDPDPLPIECISGPFGARSVDIEGLTFCIYVGFENATESDSEWDSYTEYTNDRTVDLHSPSDSVDVSGLLQLLTVPESVKSVTVNYKFRSFRLGLEWQQIVTMKPGDVVGPPTVTVNEADSIYSTVPLLFDCEIDVLLIDGQRPSPPSKCTKSSQ